jgi:glycosyltransferase involved in cell wall biosynthesis
MVTVIVCTYNRSRRLKAMLESLQKMHVPADLAWELVVVDNNSSDDTEEVVKEYQRTVRFDVRYFFESTQGHSHARNRGIVESRGLVLAFTDDDVIVNPHWLMELRDSYDRFDCLGIGGRIVPVWSCARPAWLQEDGPYALMRAIVSFDEGEDTSVLKTPPFGANMSFRRTAFERYGLFRTDLGRRGARLMCCEDTEFGRRLLSNNETLIYNSRAIVYHPVEKERTTRSYFQRWYFQYGRASVRTEVSAGGLDRFRTQAKSLRRLGASLLRWTMAVNPQRRLYYRLAACESLGRIRESCSLSYAEGRVIPRLTESRINTGLPDRPSTG